MQLCPKLQSLLAELTPNYKSLDEQVQEETEQIITNLLNPLCNRTLISVMARQGMLEETPLLKAHIWKLLLGTIPMDPSKWTKARKQNHHLYQALREKFCPYNISEEMMQGASSVHPEFDFELWNQIALDTKRTHSAINFFQSQVYSCSVYSQKPSKNRDVLSRILYIWGRTNSSVGYVQGMNEILAPLYYLEYQNYEAGDWDRQSQVFSMFSSIMSSIIDMHIKQMDQCESGIMGRMVSLDRYLRVVDAQLWAKMDRQAIYPECYSFRWLALLLSQEFGLHDTIRLWDHILSYSEQNLFFFVESVCIAILKLRRKVIMQSDFMTSLPLIQKLRDMDIDQVIEVATDLFTRYHKRNINQEYTKICQNETAQKRAKDQIHLKLGKWSYADLMKRATDYIQDKMNGLVQPEQNR